ncbi:hypothetical protein [Pararhizobium sp.]|uniref:hypothetical protein n=1 Tax=Pararhizobium sp. TaxID=1977563 RepID=UPI0027186957|nr:hypothetical protein [Pararhizobium sp.]MDO9416209.1 hypothetical protein [Pararhizobium sp.]
MTLFKNGLMPALRNNSDTLLQTGIGLIGGRNAQEQAVGGLHGFAQGRKENRTVNFLRQNSPELAAAVEAGALTGADAYKLFFAKKAEAEKPKTATFQELADGTYGAFSPEESEFTVLGRAQKPATLPGIGQEFEYAQSQGFGGGFEDYLKLKGQNGSGGAKAPSGFRYTDETQAELEPIPGGPGGQIPADQAARIGMADNFLKQAPDLRQKLARGDVTGWVDQTAARNGIGEQGQVYQQMQSGVDSLIRYMTGAGMNQSEASAYAERYLPTRMDSATTAVQKLDRLTDELKSAESFAMRGRGGVKRQEQGADPLGIRR